MKCKYVLVLIMVFLFFVGLKGADIHDAASKDDLPALKKLLAGDPGLLKARDDNFRTPLHIAARDGRNEAVRLLVSAGAGLHLMDWDFRIPLHWAAFNGHLDVVKTLFKHKAPLDIETYLGKTPVLEAVSAGKKKVLQFFLDNGCSLAEKGNNGLSMLHYAAEGDHGEIVLLLLEKGMDVNIRDDFGKTPLHSAAAEGHLLCVQLLVKHGADIHHKSLNAATALHLAVNGNYLKVKSYLEHKGAKMTPRPFPLLQGPYLGCKPPGTTPRLFAPGIITTDGYEFAGTFSPDGKEFYFTRRGGEEKLKTNTIMVTRIEKNRWTKPVPASFSGKYNDIEPHISPDGKRLYYSSRRPAKKEETQGSSRQWFMEKKGDAWADPQPLGGYFKDRFSMFVTQARSGALYFTGRNEKRNFVITVAGFQDGKMQEPRILTPKVNRFNYNAHPCIAPDESYLVFDAQPKSPENFTDYLYISYKNQDGSWTEARRLGNGSVDFRGMCPMVSPDGKYLFYSKRGNFYWVDAEVLKR
ncbi:MAG: hypothetical protein GY765_01095 [bacterium]|nr:hypothetical protein [bacterium]